MHLYDDIEDASSSLWGSTFNIFNGVGKCFTDLILDWISLSFMNTLVHVKIWFYCYIIVCLFSRRALTCRCWMSSIWLILPFAASSKCPSSSPPFPTSARRTRSHCSKAAARKWWYCALLLPTMLIKTLGMWVRRCHWRRHDLYLSYTFIDLNFQRETFRKKRTYIT